MLPPRQVSLVLCDGEGAVHGSMRPFEVALPYWQAVDGVVAGARETAGVEVTVLRLLSAHRSSPAEGGPVTYLAEVGEAPQGLLPWEGPAELVRDDPLRLPYARPGGPARDLVWATDVLGSLARPLTAAPEQQRTWNLSSIWRLPTESGPVWLKVVPPFFAHEGEMLRRLGRDHPGLVPPLLGADGPRVLLDDVPGGDHYDAQLPVLLRLVRALVGLQVEWVDRVPELEHLGVPDWRGGRFAEAARDVLSRTAEQLEAGTVQGLQRLVDRLPERFEALAECGVPDSLVHGDFHPGNACGDPDDPVLLDWGDCGVGHPLLDQTAFTARLGADDRATVLGEWARLWRDAVTGCDPQRASRLLAPVAALRQAVVYRSFLDRIEASERIYHAGDPASWLRRSLASAEDV